MKKLLRELAFQLRSALPFAIVDNGTWGDGTHRSRSYLSKLISYQNVQDAIDSGNTHIKIKPGLYPAFEVNVNNVKIEGSHGQSTYGSNIKHATIIDGYLGQAAYSDAIKINGALGVHISNLQAKTTPGNGAEFSTIYIDNSAYVTLRNITINGSDRYGVKATGYSTHIKVINCEFVGNMDDTALIFVKGSGTVNNCGVFESHFNQTSGTAVYLAPTPATDVQWGGCFVSDNYMGGANSHVIWTRGTLIYGCISGNSMLNASGAAVRADFEAIQSTAFVGNAWSNNPGGGFSGNTSNCVFSLNA